MAITKVITANDIDSATLEIKNNKLTVKVADIVPAAKADKFLKAVTVSEDGTKLKFTVAGEGAEDTVIETPVANLLTGLATQAALDAEKEKVTSLTERVTTLEGKAPTAEQIAALIANEAVTNAILTAIKGEEIQDLAEVTKGYLIKA